MKLQSFHPDKTEEIKAELERVEPLALAFDKVARIYSAQEGLKATDLAGATFAEALDRVLSAHPEGVKNSKLQGLLNMKWEQLQKEKGIARILQMLSHSSHSF